MLWFTFGIISRPTDAAGKHAQISALGCGNAKKQHVWKSTISFLTRLGYYNYCGTPVG